MDDLLNTKTDEELLRSVLAELAKAKNELNCATADVKKAQSRISFLVMIANKLIDREERSNETE